MDRLGEWDPPQSWHSAENRIMNLALKLLFREREGGKKSQKESVAR